MVKLYAGGLSLILPDVRFGMIFQDLVTYCFSVIKCLCQTTVLTYNIKLKAAMMSVFPCMVHTLLMSEAQT